jgi:cell division septation protein DedD
MSDSEKDSHAFDEDALKQALSEPLESSADSGSDNGEPAEPLYDEGEAETLEPMEDDEYNEQDSENMQQLNVDNEVATENVNDEIAIELLPAKESDHHFDEDALKQALSEPLEPPVDSEPENSKPSEPSEPLYDEDDAESDSVESIEENDEFNDQDSKNIQQTNRGDEVATEVSDDEVTNISPKTEGNLNSATKPSSDSSRNCDNNSNSGISWVVIVVIVLAAAGFTVSNWMANQKIAALKVQLENIESRMNNGLGADANQVTNEKTERATNSGQGDEAILMQLATQIMENREAIAALKQPVMDAAVQNNTDTAIAVSAPPSTSSEDSIASPASPKAEQAEVAEKVAVKAADTAKQADAAKQEMPMPAPPKPVSRNKDRGWNIIIMSLKNEAMADSELAALLKNGQQAEKHTVKVHGETFHQLRTGRFERKEDALAYIKNVIKGLGYKDAWIGRMK